MSQFSEIVLTILFLGYCYAKPKPIFSEQDPDRTDYLLSYVVGIERKGSNVCGGSLIRSAVVLTAAHYLVGNKVPEAELTIRGGSKYVNKGGVTRNVRTSACHQKFNATRVIDYNVCVLQLAEPFRLGFDRVAVIAIAQEYNLEEGTLVRVTGWGRYNQDRTKYTRGMSSVMIPVTNETYCRRFTEWRPGLDAKICAGGKEGATHGDAGGPLVYNGQQIGLATGGKQENLPQIYTNVVLLRNWIGTFANRFERYFVRSLPYELYEY